MRDPNNYSPVKSDASGARPTESAPVAPETAQRGPLAESPPPNAPGTPTPTPIRLETQVPADAPPRPKPLAKNAWRVNGSVFDLATLSHATGVEIVFAHEGQEPITAVTDEEGAYEADIPKGEGWTVSARSPNHRRGQLVDLDPSYRARDIDERRAALNHISDGDLSPAPVEWNRKKNKVRFDLVVVPRHWPGNSNH